MPSFVIPRSKVPVFMTGGAGTPRRSHVIHSSLLILSLMLIHSPILLLSFRLIHSEFLILSVYLIHSKLLMPSRYMIHSSMMVLSVKLISLDCIGTVIPPDALPTFDTVPDFGFILHLRYCLVLYLTGVQDIDSRALEPLQRIGRGWGVPLIPPPVWEPCSFEHDYSPTTLLFGGSILSA